MVMATMMLMMIMTMMLLMMMVVSRNLCNFLIIAPLGSQPDPIEVCCGWGFCQRLWPCLWMPGIARADGPFSGAGLLHQSPEVPLELRFLAVAGGSFFCQGFARINGYTPVV